MMSVLGASFRLGAVLIVNLFGRFNHPFQSHNSAMEL